MSPTKKPTGLDALFDGKGMLHAPGPMGAATSDAPSSKTCARCKRTLPLDDFTRKSSSVDGRQPYCRKCKNEANKEYKKKLKAPEIEHRTACPYCSFKGTSKGMGQHISKAHPEKCTHVCTTCGFRSYSMRGLELHYLYKHNTAAPPAVEEPPKAPELVCKECGFVCHSRSGLSRHTATHHPQSCKYRCNICGAMLYSRNALEGHIGTAHADAIQSTKIDSEAKKTAAESLESPPKFKYVGDPTSEKISAILAFDDPDLFGIVCGIIQSVMDGRDTRTNGEASKPEENAIEIKSGRWARFKARWSR